MTDRQYDVIIVGGGPAGLTAGLYCSRAKLRTLLVERMIQGGQVMTTTQVENYPGFPGGVDGPELMQRFQEHSHEFGLEDLAGEVEQLEDRGEAKALTINGETYLARAVIVATGAEPRKLGLANEAELTGRGVSYCATCDGAFFRNVPVGIVGGGDTAAEEAMFLSRFASRVYLIHRRDQLRATKVLQDRLAANPKIEIVWNATVSGLRSDNRGLTGIELTDTVDGSRRELELAGLFMAIGVQPKAQFLRQVLQQDGSGYILTDADCRTSIPGVFAAGDVRKKELKQIATAVGDGALAAIMAEKYLESL